MSPREHSIDDMLKPHEVSHLFHFFRDDVPENTKYDVITNLLYDSGVSRYFKSDTKGDANVTFDITRHLSGHVWGFVQGYGAPVYDLGFCFWLGKNLDKVLEDLESEINQAMNGEKNYGISSEKRESVLAQWKATQDYVNILKELDRNLPISELIRINPEPNDIFSYTGNRFSFFLFYLPFHQDGEKTSQTYRRREEFFRELSKLLEKPAEDLHQDVQSPKIPEYESWIDKVYYESWGDVNDAMVEDALIKGQELYQKQRGGGDTRENYLLERLAMHLAFGIGEDNVRDESNIEKIIEFIGLLTGEEALGIQKGSLYALKMIGEKGYDIAFNPLIARLQKGLPKAIQYVQRDLSYLLE